MISASINREKCMRYNFKRLIKKLIVNFRSPNKNTLLFPIKNAMEKTTNSSQLAHMFNIYVTSCLLCN